MPLWSSFCVRPDDKGPIIWDIPSGSPVVAISGIVASGTQANRFRKVGSKRAVMKDSGHTWATVNIMDHMDDVGFYIGL